MTPLPEDGGYGSALLGLLSMSLVLTRNAKTALLKTLFSSYKILAFFLRQNLHSKQGEVLGS